MYTWTTLIAVSKAEIESKYWFSASDSVKETNPAVGPENWIGPGFSYLSATAQEERPNYSRQTSLIRHQHAGAVNK